MKPFELRLAQHHQRNSQHLRRLQAFADSPRFNIVPEEEQSLIALQIEFMQQLDNILTSRMKIHNIPV